MTTALSCVKPEQTSGTGTSDPVCCFKIKSVKMAELQEVTLLFESLKDSGVQNESCRSSVVHVSPVQLSRTNRTVLQQNSGEPEARRRSKPIPGNHSRRWDSVPEGQQGDTSCSTPATQTSNRPGAAQKHKHIAGLILKIPNRKSPVLLVRQFDASGFSSGVFANRSGQSERRKKPGKNSHFLLLNGSNGTNWVLTGPKQSGRV